MFFTYADKQTSRFFGEWQTREIAFDTRRRYLYYSVGDLPAENCTEVQPTRSQNVSLAGSPVDQRPPEFLGGAVAATPTMDPETNRSFTSMSFILPKDSTRVFWKRKIKVDEIAIVSVKENFPSEDSTKTELDYLQIHIGGEVRSIAVGETPPPGPLLCPSTGFENPDRFLETNEEYIRDAFFLRELYEALRDEFREMRRERETKELTTGKKNTYKYQTLESPKARNTFSRTNRDSFVLRMRSEYELQRFYYVVKTVLGYDKLCTRPLNGLPPYDPRNDLIYAQAPLTVWHTFKKMDQCVFYVFSRGNFIGRRNAEDPISVLVEIGFLCVSNDSILVLRASGTIPGWALLREVKQCFYNDTSATPYVVLLTDDGPPDLAFIPTPSTYAAISARTFNPRIEVKRIVNTIYSSCFKSVHVRRVINCYYAEENTAEEFIRTYETSQSTRLNFYSTESYPSGASNCPWPKEDLLEIWQQMRIMYSNRERLTDGQAAIPIYANHTNDEVLHVDQLPELSRRLARERTAVNDIVGIAYNEVQRVPGSGMSRMNTASNLFNVEESGDSLPRRNSVANGLLSFNASRTRNNSDPSQLSGMRNTNHRNSSSNNNNNSNSGTIEVPALTRQSSSDNSRALLDEGPIEPASNQDDGEIHNFDFDASSEDEDEEDDDTKNPYAYKGGSRYFTQSELLSGSAADIIVENHKVMKEKDSRRKSK